MNTDHSLPSLLRQPLPPSFERREVVFPPGCAEAYDSTQWQGAIVVVEQGQIELECLDGRRLCFGRGDMLWLSRLPLRTLHNRGHAPAVLVAIWRRAAQAGR